MKEALEVLKAIDFDFMYWVAGLFALLEMFKWIYTTKDFWLKAIGIKTKGMLQREEYEKRLKNVEVSIAEIKDTSKHNVEMFLEHEKQVVDGITSIKKEIVSELNKLNHKIDEQRDEMNRTNEANRKTQRAMLRADIANAMSQFGENVGPDGKVHISLSDYENLDGLFEEYFSKDGNGTFKRIHEDEFQHFVIDR